MKRLSATLLASAALTATAAEFNPANVPAQARWVAHLDLDALRQTQLGQVVLQHLNQGQGALQMDALKAMLGVDPRRDLHSFTACGASDKPEEAALIAHATLEPEKLLTLLKLNATYTGEPVGEGLTLHSWLDEKKPAKPRQYGMFVGDRVVLSGGKEAMKVVATTLLGKGDSLAGGDTLDTSVFKGSFLAAAANLEGVAVKDPKAAMLRNARSLVAAVAEKDGALEGSLVVTTVDDATAAQIHAMATGMLAFVQLNQDADPNVKKLAQGLTAAQNGKQVVVKLRLPVAELKEKLEEQLRRQEAKRNA